MHILILDLDGSFERKGSPNVVAVLRARISKDDGGIIYNGRQLRAEIKLFSQTLALFDVISVYDVDPIEIRLIPLLPTLLRVDMSADYNAVILEFILKLGVIGQLDHDVVVAREVYLPLRRFIDDRVLVR